MKKYEETQETGVFFNKIPAHWEIKRGKDVIDILSGYPFASELFDIDVTLGFPLIRIRNVVTGATDTYYKGDILRDYVINSGDILIGMDGDYNCAMWNSEPALLNQRVCRVKGKNGLLDKYLFYSLPFHLQIINDLTYFTTVKHLSSNDIKEISLPVPPLPEQRAIAAYLDRKTAQLDMLLAQKEALLQMLHQKRQALINEAVTQGLDPAAPRKPSGVEWLGDVPAHWELRKITRAFSKIGSGTTPEAGLDKYYHNGTINWVNTGDLNDGILNGCQKKITELALEECSALKIYPVGTILVAMYGATIGKTSLMNFEACTNQACCALTTGPVLNDKFALYWFLANKPHIISLGYGGGQPNISQDTIRQLRIQTPPIEEQEAIVAHLDFKSTQINEATAAIHTQIKTLKAYRQSLISEVVTGKMDVRTAEAVAPEADLPLWRQ